MTNRCSGDCTCVSHAIAGLEEARVRTVRYGSVKCKEPTCFTGAASEIPCTRTQINPTVYYFIHNFYSGDIRMLVCWIYLLISICSSVSVRILWEVSGGSAVDGFGHGRYTGQTGSLPLIPATNHRPPPPAPPANDARVSNKSSILIGRWGWPTWERLSFQEDRKIFRRETEWGKKTDPRLDLLTCI